MIFGKCNCDDADCIHSAQRKAKKRLYITVIIGVFAVIVIAVCVGLFFLSGGEDNGTDNSLTNPAASRLPQSPQPTDDFSSDEIVPDSGYSDYIIIGGKEFRPYWTEIDLSGTGLSDSDLEALKHIPHMTKLNLGNNQISDLTPLASLVNLTHLQLGQNQISDLKPLVSLVNLTHLSVDRNRISDLTPLAELAELANLTYLDLKTNQIIDLTPLAELTDLTYLHLDRNRISDLSPLKDLTNLTFLCLESNQISDLSSLLNLKNLTELYLTFNKISDLTPLSGLTSLSKLTLGHNEISDLTPLAELENLSVLSLRSNEITDLSPLSSLANLIELDAADNLIGFNERFQVSHVRTVDFSLQRESYLPEDTPSEATDISHIPYYGDREKIRLPAEQALAYAEAIRRAEIPHFSSDTVDLDAIYPVLIDISGDGVPLLLIAQKDRRGASPTSFYDVDVRYLLFGFANGELQRIASAGSGMGVAAMRNENLLSFYWGYYGITYELYTVTNGFAELSAIKVFEYGPPDGITSIDGIQVSPEKYWETIEEMGRHIESLLSLGPGGQGAVAFPPFSEYLTHYFTREQAAQIFLDYAEMP